MIAHAKPQPDDGPEPELVTPKRVAAELVAIATRAGQLRIQARSLALYLAPEPGDAQPTARNCLAMLADSLARSSDQATDLATAVRVGQVALDERYLDPMYRHERPLLDAIEGRPLARLAEAIAPVVAARAPDDPTWLDRDSIAADEPLQLPVSHPQEEPARKAARRRKTQTPKGGAP